MAWLKKNDILPCAYSPLGGTAGSDLRENAIVKKIADAHSVAGPNILLSWLLKRGVVPLPKSVTPSRIEANFKSEPAGFICMQVLTAAVDLTDAEFEEIEKLSKSQPAKRVCDQRTLHDPEYDIYQEEDPEFSDKAQWAKEN